MDKIYRFYTQCPQAKVCVLSTCGVSLVWIQGTPAPYTLRGCRGECSLRARLAVVAAAGDERARAAHAQRELRDLLVPRQHQVRHRQPLPVLALRTRGLIASAVLHHPQNPMKH